MPKSVRSVGTRIYFRNSGLLSWAVGLALSAYSYLFVVEMRAGGRPLQEPKRRCGELEHLFSSPEPPPAHPATLPSTTVCMCCLHY